MRYLLLTTYDGTCFSGWQRQPGKRTVQSVMEEAAREIFGSDVRLTASGRTDAGVHALGQVVGLDAATGIPPEKLSFCFNRLLPPDVKVRESAVAPEGLDPSRSVKQKTYLYRAYHSPCEQPLFGRFAARLSAEPDLFRMREAGKLLLGEHDFAAFRSAGFSSKTSVRTILSLTVEAAEREWGKEYSVSVTGNGFLYNMVRILAGELFAVGCGKEERISRAFETGARSELAKTMPPCGLVLMKVDYGVPVFGAKER